jgi:hypothetical protein
VGSLEERPQRSARHIGALQREVEIVGQSGEHVDQGHRNIDARWHVRELRSFRPQKEQRDVDQLLEDIVAVAEGAVLEELLAVVRHDDDQRISAEVPRVDFRQQVSHREVGPAHLFVVAAHHFGQPTRTAQCFYGLGGLPAPNEIDVRQGALDLSQLFVDESESVLVVGPMGIQQMNEGEEGARVSPICHPVERLGTDVGAIRLV